MVKAAQAHHYIKGLSKHSPEFVHATGQKLGYAPFGFPAHNIRQGLCTRNALFAELDADNLFGSSHSCLKRESPVSAEEIKHPLALNVGFNPRQQNAALQFMVLI